MTIKMFLICVSSFLAVVKCARGQIKGSQVFDVGKMFFIVALSEKNFSTTDDDATRSCIQV